MYETTAVIYRCLYTGRYIIVEKWYLIWMADNIRNHSGYTLSQYEARD